MSKFKFKPKFSKCDFAPEASALHFDAGVCPPTQFHFDDMHMLLVPPGPVQVECTLSMVTININLGPATGALALNSDVIRPGPPLTNDYFAYFPFGTNFKVQAENTVNTILLEVPQTRVLEWFEETNIDPNSEPEGFPFVKDTAVGQLGQLAEAALQEQNFGNHEADALMMEAIILGIAARCIARISSNHSSSTSQTKQWSRMHDNARLARAVEYAMTHLSDPNLRIEDMAKQANLSAPHFSQIFKRSKGLSPYAFILSERLRLAKRTVIQTKMPISEIAYACGFSSQSHMTTSFSKHFGTTPARIRK